MKISSQLPPVRKQPPTPPERGLLEQVAGGITGIKDAVFFTVPGARTGYQISRGKADMDTLRMTAGLQGAVVGAAAGLCAGPFWALGGVAVAGLGSMLKADFNWRESSSQQLSDRVEAALAKHPKPTTAREKAAYHARGLLVGARVAREEAYESGFARGAGKMAGLKRGLANFPEALTRDSSQGVGPTDSQPRSLFKQVLGAPLGVAASLGSTLAGGLAGATRYGTLGNGLWASAALGTGATVAALALGAPALAVGLGALLIGAPAVAMAATAVSTLRDGENSASLRFDARKRNDDTHVNYADPISDMQESQYADLRQYRIEGFAAGMKNGTLEGFQAGSRMTDPLVDGAVALGRGAWNTVKQFPEKVKGVIDAIVNPE